jgi:hypothetical protein
MKFHSFAHKETGLFNGCTFGTDDPTQLAANVPADHVAIEGVHDHRNKRADVATGEVVEYQPSAPNEDHEWNSATKLWELKPEVAAMRLKRAMALNRIQLLEASQHRHVREHCLGLAGAADRLKEIDAEITALRADLKE